MSNTPWVFDDGGRAEAGFRGLTGDCVTRAIAIALGQPYREVYDALNHFSQHEKARNAKIRSSARTGVHRRVYDAYLKAHDWQWRATMKIGSGCQVHLSANELPPGRLIVRVSRHVVAVIDGVIHDTWDPSRDGARCVYGYYYRPWE
jgi:hypothetical protein